MLAFLGYSPPEGLVFEIFRGNEMPIFTLNTIETHADIERKIFIGTFYNLAEFTREF